MIARIDTLLHWIYVKLYWILPESVVKTLWKRSGASWVCDKYDKTMTEEDNE